MGKVLHVGDGLPGGEGQEGRESPEQCAVPGRRDGVLEL